MADERKKIVRLDSAGNYPHNGLAGFAFDPQGNLHFALGENLGAPYNLIGSDSTTLSGGGEYAIHGTNNPGSIGGFVSFGCIRMHNSDIMDLYRRVDVGTRVVVLR